MSTVEHEPLLQGSERRSRSKDDDFWGFTAQNRFYICIALFRIFHTFFFFLFELPLVRLVERAVCQEHYKGLPSGPDWRHLDEDLCKTSGIQSKVAYVIGFRQSFKAIPGLLTAISYGALADAWGRRPVLSLACTGETLALSWLLLVCYSNTAIKIEVAWLEALFYFIGGGTRLVHALEFTIIADYVPPRFRSRAIFLMHSIAHLVRIPALLVSSLSMDKRLWLPFALAFLCMAIALASLAVLPETLPSDKSSPVLEHTSADTHSIAGTSHDPAVTDIAASRDRNNKDVNKTTTYERVSRLFRRRGLSTILAMFLLKKMAFEGAEGSLIYQYASKKSGMKLNQTFGVRLAEIIGAVAVTLVILPLITHFWHSEGAHLGGRDLWIARYSMLLEATGFFCVFNASSITSIYAAMLLEGFGQGLEAALQNVGSFVAGKALHAGFFTFVTLLDTLGEFIGAPIMAALFSITDSEGALAGYCFLASMIVFILMFLISFSIKSV